MLHHWIKNNAEHALNYRNWAKKSKTNDQEEVGALLEAAAEMSLAVNERFQKALVKIKDE